MARAPLLPTANTIATSWNVVVTLPENTFREACRLLGRWGRVERTGFYNVLVMQVADPDAFRRDFAAAVAQSPGLLNIVSHVVPAHRTFDFRTREEFEHAADDIVQAWLPQLAGASFHVRLHRRGEKNLLSSQAEERRLAETLLLALAAAGTPGRIGFEDPDRVIAIETVGERAGVSLWSREDRRSCPFLGRDG